MNPYLLKVFHPEWFSFGVLDCVDVMGETVEVLLMDGSAVVEAGSRNVPLVRPKNMAYYESDGG